MTLVAAPERRLADPARERLRRDHARAVEKLLQPVEDAFARAVLRILRAALARVSPALVAAGDQFDLAGLEGMGAAWGREVPELAAQLHDVYGAGVLGAQQQFPQAWARAQAADATAAATMNERALDFLGTASNRLVQVDDAMWGRVRDQLQQGIAAGEGIPQMQTRVRDTLESTELRARTIARTEAVGALNRGSIDGVQSLGGYAPAFKEWLATSDERTRESHLDADGQRVGTDDTFTVGDSQLAYPGDESGPAEEVINCRCSLIYTDEPPEGEEAPTPPTDDTEAQGEPAPEAELTIEPPPTTLDPADQARAEIHSLRDEYEAATRELRGVDPADGSPNRLNPDDHYRYTRPEEVREYDQVVIGDSRYNVLSPTDEAGEMKVAALRGEPDEGFIGRRPWTDVDEVYQRNGSGMRFKLDDPEGRAERAASRVGARVDDEVQRRLELDGIHPPNPGIELDREAVQAAHRDLWEQQDAIYQRIRDEVRHAAPDLRLGEQINRARELTRQDPEWVRLDGERDSLFRQLRDGNPFDRQMIAHRDEYARVLRDILDETRGVGGASLDITGSRPAQEMARVAERVYPREWIESSNNAGGLKVERSGNRAYYSHYDPAGPRLVQNGAPGSGYGQEVTVHEFGHRMEYTRDDITELERQFYERRTGGEDLKRLRDVTGNRAYNTRELTREDKFADAYMGKQYGTSKESPWELFTMGMQSVASPEVSDQATRWIVKLFAEDSDYIRWLIGVLFVA